MEVQDIGISVLSPVLYFSAPKGFLYEVSIKNWLRGAEPFLTSFAHRLVKKFPAIYKKNSDFPYRVHDRPQCQLILRWISSVHALPKDFFKTHFNITLLSKPRFSKCPISLRVSPSKPCTHLPVKYKCRMPRSYHSWLHLPHNIWWLPKVPYYLVPFGPKFLTQERQENT